LTFTNLGLDLEADVTLFKCDACGKEGAQSISDYERTPFTERHPAECTAPATQPDRRVMTTTVEFVYLDSNPFTSVNGVIDNEYAALSQPFLDALSDLGTHLDSAHCWRCGDPVGFVLTVQPVGERLFWTETGLARQGDGAVAVLCGPCSPYVPDAAEAAQVAQAAR
jgi:hypothetical protein